MGLEHTGFYHLFDDNERLLVTRKVKVFSDLDTHSALAKEGERDILFLSSPGVSIGVTPADDKDNGVKFLDSYSVLISLRFSSSTKQEPVQTRIPGRCNKCLNALAEYHQFLENGMKACPYCGGIFTTIKSSNWADIEAVGISRLTDPAYDKMSFLPPFELPFGYPRPREVSLQELRAINGPITEKTNTQYLKASFLEILQRNDRPTATV